MHRHKEKTNNYIVFKPFPGGVKPGRKKINMERLNAEWIGYMDAYRIYNPKKPQNTVAYVSSLEEAERSAEEGYELVLCDDNAINMECY